MKHQLKIKFPKAYNNNIVYIATISAAVAGVDMGTGASLFLKRAPILLLSHLELHLLAFQSSSQFFLLQPGLRSTYSDGVSSRIIMNTAMLLYLSAGAM